VSLRIFAFLFGVVLLLPSGCSIGYMVLIIPNEFKSTYHDPYLSIAEGVWAFSFLVSFGGILLIRNALRVERDERPRSGDPPAKPE
jgi:hypothetical protein